MKVFKIHVLTTTTLRYKKPPIHNKDLTLVFPVELEKILDKFLSKYDISTDGFFFWNLKIDIWACVCFTEEHDIGGHVIASRKKKSNVVFTPYSRAPDTPGKQVTLQFPINYFGEGGPINAGGDAKSSMNIYIRFKEDTSIIVPYINEYDTGKENIAAIHPGCSSAHFHTNCPLI